MNKKRSLHVDVNGHAHAHAHVDVNVNADVTSSRCCSQVDLDCYHPYYYPSLHLFLILIRGHLPLLLPPVVQTVVDGDGLLVYHHQQRD
jgi:hypothetical protein